MMARLSNILYIVAFVNAAHRAITSIIITVLVLYTVQYSTSKYFKVLSYFWWRISL